MTRKRPLFSSSNQSPEILRTRWILQKKEAVKESLSGGDMKKWLAVGVMALGTSGLLMMRGTKSAVAAPQVPSRELAPLQLIQKIPVPGVAGRIDHFTAFPKRRLLIFAALGNNSMEIVNTFQAKVVQSVKGLDEPQGVLYVPGLDKIFVVNAIDRKTGELTKWGLNEVKANYPMALDEDDHRLFVVTRRPPFLIVLDTDTGKEVARVPVGGSCDDVYYDLERKRIYALGGEGFISVVQQNDPDHYTLSANIPSAVGVRTGIFYGTSLYVGVPASGLEPAQIWNYAVPE